MTTSVQQMKIALEEKIQEQIHESNAQLNGMTVAPNVLSAMHGHVVDLLSSTVGKSAPVHGVGASRPTVSTPAYDPNGGYMDNLANLIENIQNSPNDPQNVLAFIDYLTSGKVDLNNPDVQKLLQQFGVTGTMIGQMMQECILYNYYMPTSGNINDNPPGLAGAQNYINNILSQLQGMPSSPIAQEISSGIGAFNLTAWDNKYHVMIDGQYEYVWNIPNTDGSGTYQQLMWNNPAGDGEDNFMIMELIGNCQLPGQAVTQNPYVMKSDAFADFMRDYRVNALNTIWAETKNPQILLMYFMTLYDNDYQSQESGLGNTTNLLTGATNNYANQLLTIATNFGNGGVGAEQAKNFVRLLMSGTTLMNMENQTQGIAGNWQTNVFNATMNVQVSLDGGKTFQSLGGIVQAYLKDPSYGDAPLNNLVTALNSLNPPPSGSSPTYNPGYQSMLSALQTGGSLVTGTSKMVNTQLSTVSSLDSQVIKLGSATAASDGGGFMQMLLAIINNFQSR